MKHPVLIASFLLLLTGCSYDYYGKRNQKDFHREYQSAIRQSQVRQLRQLDSTLFRNGSTVYIRPLMARHDGTGLYAYNRHSTHFGHVHYFEYLNDSVIRISCTNEDSLKTEVERFLREQKFSKRRIRVAMKRLRVTYAINSTDSF